MSAKKTPTTVSISAEERKELEKLKEAQRARREEAEARKAVFEAGLLQLLVNYLNIEMDDDEWRHKEWLANQESRAKDIAQVMLQALGAVLEEEEEEAERVEVAEALGDCYMEMELDPYGDG